jgi:hypothetical protein
MAGAACTFTPTCKNISTQSLAIFKRIGPVTTKVEAVEERLGIAWEAFNAVEAFMRILPPELAGGGWN